MPIGITSLLNHVDYLHPGTLPKDCIKVITQNPVNIITQCLDEEWVYTDGDVGLGKNLVHKNEWLSEASHLVNPVPKALLFQT